VLRPSSFVELGTHNGYSYFSVCETIERIGLSCTAHAVDTWQGDDQAGFYGDGVYPGVVAANEADYAEFSTLHRCTFDEALDEIEDGSVDLLHIDGRHGYEDVRHDYLSWVPKLSPRAVVIFHDIAERREGFGVWRFWDEVASKTPSFAFEHNHGLGVLGVGPDLDEAMVRFFREAHQDAAEVRAFYAALGAKVTAGYDHELLDRRRVVELQAQSDRADGAERRLAELEAELLGLRNQLDQVRSSTSWRVTRPLRALRRTTGRER
jgi:hypothetical protein